MKRFPVAGGNADAIATMLKEKYKDAAFGSHHRRRQQRGHGLRARRRHLRHQRRYQGRRARRAEGRAGPDPHHGRQQDGRHAEGHVRRPATRRRPPPSSRRADGDIIKIHGTQDQITEIKAAIKELDNGAGNSLRVISLDKGSGAAVAEDNDDDAEELDATPIRLKDIINETENAEEADEQQPDPVHHRRRRRAARWSPPGPSAAQAGAPRKRSPVSAAGDAATTHRPDQRGAPAHRAGAGPSTFLRFPGNSSYFAALPPRRGAGWSCAASKGSRRHLRPGRFDGYASPARDGH